MPETIITVAAIGIDLGDDYSHYACLDDQGKIIEEGRVRMTRPALRKTFSGEPTKIALEAGAQSRWVSQLLAELGHEVVIANPRQLQLISSSSKKNDLTDAVLLARLVRFDTTLLSPVLHRPNAVQRTLLAVRARKQLVQTRVRLTHCIRGMVKTFGLRLPSAHNEEYMDRCRQALPPEILVHLEGLLHVVQELTRQIAQYDEHLADIAAKEYPEVARLQQIDGVGLLTALTYVLTLADPHRFPNSRIVGAYLGLRPKQRQSGESDPQLRISKMGDSYLRTLLVQCAHVILSRRSPDSALRRWGLGLCERGGKNAKKRAIVAVARKLSVLLHRIWVSGDVYRPFPAN